MYNKCIFIGRMTKDAQPFDTKTGIKISKFSLAVNNKYKKDNQVIEETMFIDCTCFNVTAENVLSYTHKGMLVLVEGKLKQETWQDSNTGQNRHKHVLNVDTVKFLEFKNDTKTDTGTTKEPEWMKDAPPF